MAQIRYAPSGDEFVPSAAPTLVDDGGDSWWSGVALSFAQVAIVGALAASALSAQIASRIPQDEGFAPVVSAPTIVEESEWAAPTLQPIAYRTRDLWSYEQNDFAVAPASTIVEESEWNVATPQSAQRYTVPDPWSFDTQEPAGSLFGQYDEDFWVSGVAPQPLTFRILDPGSFDAGEIVPQPAPLPFDEETWPTPVPKWLPPVVPAPWWFETDTPPSTAVPAMWSSATFSADTIQATFTSDAIQATFGPDAIQATFTPDVS